MIAEQKTTSWPELTAILLARLGFLWLLVLISMLMPSDDASFYAFMGVAFIITIPYSLWLRSKLRSLQFAPLQFLVDLVLVTGLVYFTGGIQSDLTLLYPLVILTAGIVAPPKQAAEITVLGIIIYVLMATVLSQNLVVEYVPIGGTMAHDASKASLFLRVILFAAFGAVSIYVAKRCDYIHTHENDLQRTTHLFLNSSPAPTLMLDPEGSILGANGAACEMLNRSQEALCTIKFIDLCTSGKQPIAEVHGKSVYLSRENKPSLPVTYRTADIKLLETALLGNKGRKSKAVDITLLSFNDISESVSLNHQLKQVERITQATRIAGEMAHEIRTPLTAISASVQLLKHYEDKTTASDWLPNSPRRHERSELFAHIEDASVQMNTVIQNFIDFAEFSPQDLLSIIKLDSIGENQGYISHLNTTGRGNTNGQNSDSG
ncbi:histidine kinase dimerization/phospho-acceptor domain-containing protein [Pontiella sulfatireligans]|uniref:histidine kinase n=1 Tax=Pontiella sulfatireligans TaxID=2750658 RepID=A0A6C2UKZ8_9BACT|nr:histidine kinase dimerization/phospho-acceptor domain-containing protein [Pontiella sulfatireligans]VGO20081.1 hypothetical protein SCARR_02141 [Pontiella sulfatireligans]